MVWNMNFMTFHILGIIIPTDFHIFRGVGIPPTSYWCIVVVHWASLDGSNQWNTIFQYHFLEGRTQTYIYYLPYALTEIKETSNCTCIPKKNLHVVYIYIYTYVTAHLIRTYIYIYIITHVVFTWSYAIHMYMYIYIHIHGLWAWLGTTY